MCFTHVVYEDGVAPKSHKTASFLYRLSPLEFILIAGSLPRLPHRLTVSGATRRILATSFTVKRSGQSSPKAIILGGKVSFYNKVDAFRTRIYHAIVRRSSQQKRSNAYRLMTNAIENEILESVRLWSLVVLRLL